MKYPVGATWEGKESDSKFGNQHREARIWLNEIKEHIEVWYWSWSYSDGSSPIDSFDWGTSYQMCRQMIPFHCRMKRIK
jgi:hypothetical protein